MPMWQATVLLQHNAGTATAPETDQTLLARNANLVRDAEVRLAIAIVVVFHAWTPVWIDAL